MRMFFIGMAAAAMAYLTVGCAAGISPAPGINIGFDARPEMDGVSADVDPKAAGCEFGKVTSWNWLENLLCVEDVPAVEEVPAAA